MINGKLINIIIIIIAVRKEKVCGGESVMLGYCLCMSCLSYTVLIQCTINAILIFIFNTILHLSFLHFSLTFLFYTATVMDY